MSYIDLDGLEEAKVEPFNLPTGETIFIDLNNNEQREYYLQMAEKMTQDRSNSSNSKIGNSQLIIKPGDLKATTNNDVHIIYESKVSIEFIQKITQVANNLEIDPNYLMAAIAFETGRTFSPSEKNKAGSGAVGLIQFMPSTAKGLGTTVEDLSKMTDIEQLDYVEKYLSPYKGKMESIEDLYMAILFPKSIGQNSDYVLFSDGKTAYKQNKGLDSNNDGSITKAEASQPVKDELEKGKKFQNE